MYYSTNIKPSYIYANYTGNYLSDNTPGQVYLPHKSKKNWTSFWIKILICSRISLLNAEYNDIIRNIIFSIFNLF